MYGQMHELAAGRGNVVHGYDLVAGLIGDGRGGTRALFLVVLDFAHGRCSVHWWWLTSGSYDASEPYYRGFAGDLLPSQLFRSW